MPRLNYSGDFDGRNPETGSIQNVLAIQGNTAPHTGQPYSEALLMGISGGIAFGYFTFEYEGYDPHIALLTRNTFSPMTRLLERLAIPQEVRQTTSADKAETNLIDALENGQAPLVWLDTHSLPYHLIAHDPDNWAVWPVIVTAYENDTAQVVDGSRQPFTVSAEQLAAARGRIKKERYRLVTLDAPDADKLVSAVQKGIWDCIKLFTEKPPAGGKNSFGFAAYEHWAKMLTTTRNKNSWARYFEPGRRLVAALAGYGAHPGVYEWIATFGAGDGAERGLYAAFLEEAAVLLDKPALSEVAAQFRESQQAWQALALASLPEGVALLKEIRELQQQRHTLFVEAGDTGIAERETINMRLDGLREQARTAFPLGEGAVTAFREELAEHVEKIRDIEQAAIAALQGALA